MGKDFVLSIIFWTSFFLLTRFPGLRFRSGPPCGGLAAPPFQSGVGFIFRMVGQTLKQVQGDCYLLFDTLVGEVKIYSVTCMFATGVPHFYFSFSTSSFVCRKHREHCIIIDFAHIVIANIVILVHAF